MNDPFLNDMAKRFAELKEIARECEKCEHYKPYTRKDGSTGMACEHWSCEFTPKQAKISPLVEKDEAWEDDMMRDTAEYLASQEGDEKDGE